MVNPGRSLSTLQRGGDVILLPEGFGSPPMLRHLTRESAPENFPAVFSPYLVCQRHRA